MEIPQDRDQPCGPLIVRDAEARPKAQASRSRSCEHGEASSPDDTAMSLTTLFPDDHRDLDDLFPEAKFRELFKDVAAGIADVNNFVRRINLELTAEKRPCAKRR